MARSRLIVFTPDGGTHGIDLGEGVPFVASNSAGGTYDVYVGEGTRKAIVHDLPFYVVVDPEPEVGSPAEWDAAYAEDEPTEAKPGQTF